MSENRPPDVQRKLKAIAKTVAQALPYMRRYADKTVVVKYGGHAMGDEAMTADFAADVALLRQVGINVVLVHGGGPQIGAMLERLKIKTSFVDGLRVTDRETVDVVEMVLSGSVNKSLVAAIAGAGGNAVGLSGKDGGFIRARQLRRARPDPGSNIERLLDLGFVGEPYAVDAPFLRRFIDAGLIPVIAPIGLGEGGETYNINADTVAGAVAAALGAERLLLLTDVPGVMDENKDVIADITATEVRALIEDGTISGGMIPKVETCLSAVENGVNGAVIIDGRAPHALLLEIFTQFGAGTLIKPGDAVEAKAEAN